MILKLIPNTHPILHERVNKCSYDLDRHEMVKILHDNMIHHQGVGLSANQIGIAERVFIMMIDEETEETITCFNPRIVKTYDEKVWCEEGCLSLPGYFAEIERPAECEVDFIDYHGKKRSLKATGLLATCIQHEIDHLNGKLFIDYLSKLKKDMIIKKLTKQKKEINKTIL